MQTYCTRRLVRTWSTFTKYVMLSIAVENGYDRVDLCWALNEIVCSVLPRCLTLSADAASDQACCRRYVCLSTRQHSISSCKDTIKLLQQETPDFIGPDIWAPNSPDLNPVDYKVCDVMQQSVWISVVNRYPEIRISNFGSDIRIGKCPYDNQKRSANSQGLRSALAAWTPWRESSIDKVKCDTLPLLPPATDGCSNRHLFRLTAVQSL